MNIAIMSTKQWYRALLEDRVLKAEMEDNSPPTLIPVRVEHLSPSTDWSQTWRVARLPGLPSDLTAFLFKLVHCLLPTQDRVARLGGGDGLCTWCGIGEVETPMHAFFLCTGSLTCGRDLVGYVQHIVPELTPEKALRLELGSEKSDHQELAVVSLLACGFKYIWETRLEKKRPQTYRMRAEAEARVSILRKTRYAESGNMIIEMLR